MTMVAGRIVYEHGQVTTIDERALRAEAREHAEQRRSADAPVLQAAAQWLPYYREMYLKAAGRDVGMQRWAGGAQ
jgi:5-methylthioadenosine/S-adenosylhomocysteine deaminase